MKRFFFLLCDSGGLQISFYLIEFWYIVCAHNALIKQHNDRCLKILQGSAVMNASLVQNQVNLEHRVLLGPRYKY